MMEWELLIRVYGPLGAFAGLYVLLLKWVLKNAERTIEAHMAGAEAARASTEAIKKNTEVINSLNTHILMMNKSLINVEKGQKWASRKSSSSSS